MPDDGFLALAVHGGAGTVARATLSDEDAEGYRAGLRTSLAAGHAVLAARGSAVDAVTAAVVVLEDDPHFNAGRGAVLTEAGRMEMDAAIMDGRDRAAGAIACVCGPRNPILGARAVMERAGHVLLVGDAAERFLRAQGLGFAPASYFLTARRVEALEKELSRRAAGAPDRRDDADRHGTVGAVARDRAGHLAAATSTGGMTGKQPGRVGDTPILGAGTWADDATCAVSATGHGEYFMRWVVAHEIASRMCFLGEDVVTAASVVVSGLGERGGSGGLVAVDAAGRIALPFNSEGMYRGAIGPDGVPRVAIHGEALA